MPKYQGRAKDGSNPYARPLFDEVKNTFGDVKFLGIWGDAEHKKRKSDHNTGDALDIGYGSDVNKAEKILQYVLGKPQVKYAILGQTVYYPDGTIGHTNIPHHSHVHVSFYGAGEEGKGSSGSGRSTTTTTTTTPPGGFDPNAMLPFAAFFNGTRLYQMVNEAAQQLGLDPNSLMIKGGRLYAKKTGE